MYVACPSCKSLYQIEPAHLRAAGGKLHCGNCQQTFNATAAVFDEPQQALDYAQQHPVQEDVAREIDELVNMALGQVPTGTAASQAEPGGRVDEYGLVAEAEASDSMVSAGAIGAGTGDQFQAVSPADTEPEADLAAPGELEELVEEVVIESGREVAALPERRADADCYAQPVASEFSPQQQEHVALQEELPPALLFESENLEEVSRSTWGAIAASLALTLVLLGQYAWVERYQLAGIPTLRPVLDVICQHLGCDLPLRRNLGQVEIVEREVRDHPHVDDALLISASFVNRADFVQAYPLLEVSFSDVSGTPVAARRFRPAEYLSGQQHSAAGMRPGEQAYLMLEVADPGERAVSFQFEFL